MERRAVHTDRAVERAHIIGVGSFFTKKRTDTEGFDTKGFLAAGWSGLRGVGSPQAEVASTMLWLGWTGCGARCPLIRWNGDVRSLKLVFGETLMSDLSEGERPSPDEELEEVRRDLQKPGYIRCQVRECANGGPARRLTLPDIHGTKKKTLYVCDDHRAEYVQKGRFD